ncbi:efflux RND transporter periplasmic adaptor subunit [Novosphingobium sp.]|uniref:efflux RND transporter periplasmic adaptor subunit n=1 Tax=Novosphingobium sp. TaxID=1874826 RepID=UPI0027324041|nr:efflux RND transporter periplasmic adaptor subunit [Novosphingobium sp.]MDP3906199.1 efflux RND transporter periplasmic adaptor subunit [Novosphingobium sp.]
MNYDSRIDAPTAAAEPDAEDNPLLADDVEDRATRRRLWIIGAVVAALLVAVWFFTHRSGAGDAATKSDAGAVVSVITPGKTTIAGTINATGTLAARRELPVGVPGEGGQIAAVLVEPGQWVGAGQVLAVIDRSVQVQQQASQSAQIQVARANAQLAQANLDRALKLVERGFVSTADIDRLTAQRDAAAAQVRVAGATLGVLQAQTRRLNIVAPAAGLVLERRVEPGQVVGAGSGVLFRLAKGGEMELRAQLGELDLATLATGVTAQVVPAGTDKAFTGQIWQLAPVIDPASRQGVARIALAYSPELRPGGFATATITSGTIVAPLLPESAILSDDKGSFVYIVDSDNKARRRPVKTGIVTDTGVAVIEGLSGNERVVLRAGGFLQPDEKVQPRSATK